MTENMKKFLEAISKGEELAKKVSTMTKEVLIAQAKELGIELTEVDFAKPAGELDDDELDAVAGGGDCYCAVGGGGSGDDDDKTCACVGGGWGYAKSWGTGVDGTDVRCMCTVAGVGANT